LKNINILVVEDEIIIAMELESRLQEIGYGISGIAATGEEAIKKAAETKPDLVLMDIMLKGKMDGIQAAQRIESQFQLPVIFLTANTDPATIQRAKLSSPFGYLIKPFEEEAFKVTIEMALFKHHMETKLRQSESRLKTMLKSVGEAVIATDAQGQITFLNRSAEEITGWKEQFAKGEKKDTVFNIVSAKSDVSLKTGILSPFKEYTLLIGKDGDRVPIEHSSMPIVDDEGMVWGEITTFQDVSERLEIEKRIQHLATHDALTDLPNRYLFNDRLQHAVAKAKRDSLRLVVMFLDLDGFKTANDRFGHPTGDIILKQVGERIKAALREADTVARLGGDEFGIILENISQQENASVAAQKILDSFIPPFSVGDIEFSITASIGISCFPFDGSDGESLLSRADMAMYSAKNSGKNRFEFHSAA